MKWNRYSKYGFFFAAPAFLYFLAVFFYPLFLSLWDSFRRIEFISHTNKWVGLTQYSILFTDQRFYQSAGVTGLYVLITVPSLIILALILAGGVTSMGRRTRNALSVIYFLPVVSSMVAAGIVWQWLLDPTLGLVNNVLQAIGINTSIRWFLGPSTSLISVVIVGVWARVGFDLILLSGAMLTVPEVYYEASVMDGLGRIGQFFRITLPLINPQIVVVSTLELIFAFQVFDQINVTTHGGPGVATNTVMIYLINDVFSVDYGEACALTAVLLAVLFLVSYLQRRVVRRAVQY